MANKRNFNYPNKTVGSKYAAEIRAKAQEHFARHPKDRARAFKRGMKRIKSAIAKKRGKKELWQDSETVQTLSSLDEKRRLRARFGPAC